MNRPLSLLLSLALLASCANLTHADEISPLAKAYWKDKDGYDIPGAMTMVDYGSLPIALTQRCGKLFVNGSPADKLSSQNRAVLEAVTGLDSDAMVEKLKEQQSKPAHIRVEIAVLRQVGNGQLMRIPLAMLDPVDRVLAMQGGQQILQQKQLQAQIAAVARARSLAAGTVGVAAVAPTSTGPANVEQEGEFEGQFGDQSGPDTPGGVED